ncbi:MAG: hypothetical protein V1906_00810, partial [Candidatus Woesearchaeota archaeon]
MTVILKMEAKGFKSFAKKVEIPFGTRFNAVIGANGSGKCVIGKSIVHLADGSLRSIQEIVDEKLSVANITELDDGLMALGDGMSVLSLDLETLEIVERPIQAFVKRKSPNNLLKILTRSGRSVTSTEYHPLFVMDNGKIRSVKAEELKEGVKVASIGVNKLVEEVFSNQGNNSVAVQTLQILSQSDLLWDEIVGIEPVESKEEWVYDLCVEKDHNFIANHIVVHNSNIIDSLLFVFGEMSAKSMRAGKSANLIYNGGKKASPAKEAEVSVVFSNDKKEFPIDAKEVKLTRTVKQSGTSTYRINDEVMTRQQVVDMLAAAKIDPDGHNIIMQGDIIRFVEMRSAERRELIEEIAGISVYEEKKAKALSELDKVQAKLNEADIILTEREKTLSDLKKDRDQALKFKELESNIQRNKATRLSMLIKDKEEKRAEDEKRLAEIKRHVETLQKEIDELKKEIENKKVEISGIDKDLDDKGDKKQREIGKEIDELKTEVIKKSSRKDVVENELRRIKEKKSQLEKSVKEAEGNIAKALKKKEDYGHANEKLDEAIKDVQAKIDAFKEQHGIEDIEDVAKRISELDNIIEQKQRSLGEVMEAKQNLFRKKDKLDFEIRALDERIAKVQDMKKEDLDKASKVKSSKKEFEQVAKSLSSSLNESSVFASQLQAARLKLMDANDEYAKLRARNIGIKEATAGDAALSKIASMKIDGVHGTVSELGKVSSNYSLALEVAAGPRIKSMVVSTDSVAAKCIGILKESKIGTATFLPLNKLKERDIDDESRRVAKLPGAVGLAIDLVSYDSKFKTVFNFVFGATVVVDSLDNARKIGVGRARMVTLGGDLLESSGAMVGGYRRSTGMGFKEKEVEFGLDNIEKEIAKLTDTVNLLEKKKMDNDEAIMRLRERKAILEAEITTFGEKGIGVDDITKLRSDRVGMANQMGDIDKQLANADQDKESFGIEIERLKRQKDDVKQKMAQMANSSSASELEKLDKSKADKREERIKNESHMSGADMQINMYNAEKDKTLAIMQGADKDWETFSGELADLDSVLIQKRGELKEREMSQRKFTSEYQHLFATKEKLGKRVQQIELQAIQKEERIRGVENRGNDISVKIALMNGEMEGLNKEFLEYKDVQLRRGLSLDDLNGEIKSFEQSMRSMGNVNLRALEIYEKVKT